MDSESSPQPDALQITQLKRFPDAQIGVCSEDTPKATETAYLDAMKTYMETQYRSIFAWLRQHNDAWASMPDEQKILLRHNEITNISKYNIRGVNITNYSLLLSDDEKLLALIRAINGKNLKNQTEYLPVSSFALGCAVMNFYTNSTSSILTARTVLALHASHIENQKFKVHSYAMPFFTKDTKSNSNKGVPTKFAAEYEQLNLALNRLFPESLTILPDV